MKNLIKIKTATATLISTLALSSAVFVNGIGITPPTLGFSELFERASNDGRCNVNQVSVGDSTFYIPSDPRNSRARFNVLVWGNGTGGDSTTYSSLLSSVASHCILVAAANTANAGDGTAMRSALINARKRYAWIIQYRAKVCTAGHSQGGGGSFNAANLVDADCVISAQADTRFTTQIQNDLASDVEVIALWSSADTLAPASGNRDNVEGASTILTQVETAGESHFTIVSNRGGNIGTMFRMASIAQLSTDPDLAQNFRGAFWGPDTFETANTNLPEISDVRRNAAAVATNP